MSEKDRFILKDVPQLSFHGGRGKCPEGSPFGSVMRVLMEYFKEDGFGCRSCRKLKPSCKIPCSYAYFMGVSGAASFLSWKPGWSFDNLDISYMSDNDQEPIERALMSTGYEYQFFSMEEDRGHENFFRQKIIESVKNGKPVLAFGPVGPPEASLITGYDNGGEVLIGWSFFQDEFTAELEFEPSGQFRIRDWGQYPDGFSFYIIGEKKEKPLLSRTVIGALQWMLEVTHTALTFGKRHNGLAAYSAWAEHLLREEDFPNEESVLRMRYQVHNAVVGMVADARWYGSQFLIQASDPEIIHFSVIEEILHAAACYAAEHHLMWELWDLAGGFDNPDGHRQFADLSVRKKMSAIIKESRVKYLKAAEHIRQALTKIDQKGSLI